MKKTLIILLAIMPSVLITSCKKKEGCTDPVALNYDEEAKKDDGSCVYIKTETLPCDYFKSNNTLKDLWDGVDYRVECEAEVSADIIIEPGVTIEFATDAGLKVITNGSLSAVGNSSKGIVFKGVNPIPGSWKGIFFDSNDLNNKLHYATVSHAGGASFNSNGDLGSVILYAGGRVSIKNSTINKGAAYGLNNNYSGSFLEFENNTITETNTPILLEGPLAAQLDPASQLTGNTNDQAEIHNTELKASYTWQKLTVPYLLKNKNIATMYMTMGIGGSLRILPGAIVKIASDCGIWADEGTFSAGTAGQEKVVITGNTAAPGAWRGIRFDSNDLNNKLDNVEISYAGSSDLGSGHYGAVLLWAQSRVEVTNSTIRDNSANAPCGINATLTNVTLISSNNTYINVATGECN